MRAFSTTLTAGALALGFLGATSCVASEEVVTCNRVEDYLAVCYFECLAGWDCRRHYREASDEAQQTMDFCARCLFREADLGCHDCLSPAGDSCQRLLEDTLDLTCVW